MRGFQRSSQRQISSQRLSVLLPLIVLPLELSPIQCVGQLICISREPRRGAKKVGVGQNLRRRHPTNSSFQPLSPWYCETPGQLQGSKTSKPKNYSKKTQKLHPGLQPQIPWKKLKETKKHSKINYFSGIFSIFRVFSKEFGVGVRGVIFEFFSRNFGFRGFGFL